MAHEVGHHLAGHTLDDLGSRPNLELEADKYSGFILQKLGATLDDAKLVISRIANVNASTTHPAKHDRLAAIANGWIASCNNDASCNRFDDSQHEKTVRTEAVGNPSSAAANLRKEFSDLIKRAKRNSWAKALCVNLLLDRRSLS